MRITFIISQLGGGGAERVVALLSSKLSELGHSVSIITTINKEPVYKIEASVGLYCCSSTGNKLVRTISEIKNIRKAIIKIKPDVIFSFLPVVNIQTILACKGLEVPVAVSERNDPARNPRKALIRKIRDYYYKRADGYVFQTPDAMKYFDRIRHGEGVVIPNPISSSLPEWDRVNRKKVFVTAVRLEPQKNLKMLLEAFSRIAKEYPDYKLEIYGEGQLRDELEQLIIAKSLYDQVVIMGFAKDLHERIKGATAFVLSSDYEGISNSMIEALGMGIPVISTDHPIGGARMFIRHMHNGILTQVGSVDDMYEAMKYIIENPEKAEQFSVEAKAIKDELSIETICSKWVNYAEYLCERKRIADGY